MTKPDHQQVPIPSGPYRLLGVPLILIAVGFAALPWYLPLLSGLPNAAPDPIFWPRWIMAGFTGWVGLACFVAKLQASTIRLVGLVVFGVSLWYLAVEIRVIRQHADLLPGRRSQPSLWNSVCFFLVFGLPAVYVLIHGDLPDRHPSVSTADEFDEEHH